MRRFIILAVSLVLLPPLAGAQHRFAAAPLTAGVAVPAHIVIRASHPAAAHNSAGAHVTARLASGVSRASAIANRKTNRHPGSPLRTTHDQVLEDSDLQVPGLGFDFVHYAATHPQTGHHHHQETDFFVPFFDGGFYVPYTSISEEVAPGEAQQTETVQTEEPDSSARARRSETVAPAPVAFAPQREADEYVFVRRDGTVFFAVAYSWEKDNLRYITREGLRRNVTRDALDLDATQQFNEQRGLNFRSPV